MSRQFGLISALFVVAFQFTFAAVSLHAQGNASKNKGSVRPARGVADEVSAPKPKARGLPQRPETRPEKRPETAPADPAELSEEPQEESRPTRPRAEALRVEKLSPELEKILKDWETQSAKIQKLSGPFTRRRYDHTFNVEYQAMGKFAYETPDKGAYEFEGVEAPKGKVSRMKDDREQPYALKPDQAQRWVCNGKEVLKIDDKSLTFERVRIPEESQGENIIDGPLPFLFGMKAESAKRRYSFELQEETSPDVIRLLVKPRMSKDSVNWREAEVKISAKTFLPIAVRLVAPSNNEETVHIFGSDMQVNGRGSLIKFLEKDPFKPDLRKYKLVQNTVSAPPGTTPGQAPATSKPGTGATAGAPKDRAAGAAVDRSDRNLPKSADSSNAGSKKKPATRN